MYIVVYPGSSRQATGEPPVLKKQLTAEIATTAPLLCASQSVMFCCLVLVLFCLGFFIIILESNA